MTDQIPADDLRRFIARCRTAVNGRGSILLDELEALLPDPPRPTLAGMTEEEREACQWMQADVEGVETRAVITYPNSGNELATLIDRRGKVIYASSNRVTPRPDLPRMTWPGDQEPAPAPALPDGWRLADHKRYGRVIVTTQTPNDDGRVYFVLPVCRNLMGFDWRACDPAELMYLDAGQEADTPTGPDHLAVGTVIESADDPRIAALPVGSILLDREGETVTKRCESWTGLGGAPYGHDGAEFGPWTVLHIPKEADQ